jgi:hypothetical protein
MPLLRVLLGAAPLRALPGHDARGSGRELYPGHRLIRATAEGRPSARSPRSHFEPLY